MAMTAKEKNDLRYRSARDICAFLGFDKRSLHVYGTSYGFSVDSFRGTSPVFTKLMKILEDAEIKFTIGAGAFHDEIRISTRGNNLEKFKKLGDDCWRRVMSLEGPMLDTLQELADRVDTSSEFKMSPLNTLVKIKGHVADRARRFREDREWFDVGTEIEVLKEFLPLQNDLDALNKFMEDYRKAGLEKCTNVRMGVLLKVEDEIHRLTGVRPE